MAVWRIGQVFEDAEHADGAVRWVNDITAGAVGYLVIVGRDTDFAGISWETWPCVHASFQPVTGYTPRNCVYG